MVKIFANMVDVEDRAFNLNFALTSVVCAFPECCLLTTWMLSAHTLSALSPSIAANPPALCLAFSACPSQFLSWTFSACFLNGYLRTYSWCLRTTLPHWHSSLKYLHSSLTQLTHSAPTQRTHAVRCRPDHPRWTPTCTGCALPYRCLHTLSLLLVTMNLSSLLSIKIRTINTIFFVWYTICSLE